MSLVPQPASRASSPADADEPSMEDILASIRRILSEDEATSSVGAAAPLEDAISPPQPLRGEDDVFVLDSAMMLSPPQRYEPSPSDDQQNGPQTMSEAPVHSDQPSSLVEFGRPNAANGSGEPLVAANTAASAASSVGTLMRTLVQRNTQTHTGGPTIEDMVRDEVRPLLKAWLDQNLPAIVERHVRAEIERVIARAAP